MFQLTYLLITWIFVAHCYRLPKDVIPENYRLEIITYLGEPNNFDFDGKVWITTTSYSRSFNITLHSKQLGIDEDSISVKDLPNSARYIKVSSIEFDETNDFLIIHIDKHLKENRKYEIFISFKGKLDDSLAGFYRSSYYDKESGMKKWLAVTQFEAISARLAFPCFDEPEMKATFDISIGRKDGFRAISNMPLIRTEPIPEKPGMFWDHFDTSVPMSTYLVAFIVSEFEYQHGYEVEDNNVTFRIWARKDALSQVDFATRVGPECLAFYEEFFDIDYPLPKQDMIAIPDFNAGAMENWGAITYREAYLLYDPKVSSKTSQHRVASVVAHELAHQWFGNLVTMKWWTDLWLNEGFATYMASVAIHALFPEWNSLEEEAGDNMLSVFSFDSLRTSHPVSVPIGNPKEIDEIFDTISYKKGSSLIRMMNLFLGDDVIRYGVSNYLKEHKFGNAEQDDLWAALTEEAHRKKVLPRNLTVKHIMDTWTLQTGYPVVTVIRNYERKTADISQQRYLRDITNFKDENKPCWQVPLTYSSESNRNFNVTTTKYWLTCSKPRKIELQAESDEWVIFNNQMAGIYKVNYDEKNWKLITDFMREGDFDEIPTINRVQLLSDAADLAFIGTISYNIFFDLLHYVRFEHQLMPWRAALDKTNVITNHLAKSSMFGKYKEFMKYLLSDIFEKLGGLKISETEKLDSIKLHFLIASKACRFEVSNCISDAKQLFAKFMEDPTKNVIPKDLQSVVYCTSLKHGGEKEWSFLWNQYEKSNVATEKASILATLGCTEQLWLLTRFLEWSLNETMIRRQDVTTVFTTVARNDVGYYIAKKFFYENINRIQEITLHNKRITRYLTALANQMTDTNDQKEFENFIDANKEIFQEAKQGVQQALETVKISIQWQETHAAEIGDILNRLHENKLF